MIKIAVCDDEKRMAEEISEKVKEYLPGSETEIFGSGESLLASDMESFRILLLDIDLPGISGKAFSVPAPEDWPLRPEGETS